MSPAGRRWAPCFYKGINAGGGNGRLEPLFLSSPELNRHREPGWKADIKKEEMTSVLRKAGLTGLLAALTWPSLCRQQLRLTPSASTTTGQSGRVRSGIANDRFGGYLRFQQPPAPFLSRYRAEGRVRRLSFTWRGHSRSKGRQ